MPKWCVLAVEKLLTTGRKTWWQLSPAFVSALHPMNTLCEQPLIFPTVTRKLPPRISTPKRTILPLFEQKFYPVSTAPIISITN